MVVGEIATFQRIHEMLAFQEVLRQTEFSDFRQVVGG